MVLLNHAAFATGFVLRHDLGRVVARFDIAVPMFFVLSGFLLYRPFARSVLSDGKAPDLRRFYTGRALRILPAYWVAVIGVALFFDTRPSGSFGWLSNLLALPAIGVDVPYSITPAWSIGVEISFYLLLPAYAALLGRIARPMPASLRPRALLAGTAILFLCGQLFRFAVVLGLDGNPEIQARSLLLLPMYIDLFATGMAIAVASLLAQERRVGFLHSLGSHPGASWGCAGLLLLLVSLMRAPNAPFGLNGAEYLPRQLAYSAISAIWLAPAIFGDQSAGLLRRVLRGRALTFLGSISLSFYLWHLSFVEQAKHWTIPDYDELVAVAEAAVENSPDSLSALVTFTGNWPVVSIVAFVSTVLVASFLYFTVERSFLNLKANAGR